MAESSPTDAQCGTDHAARFKSDVDAAISRALRDRLSGPIELAAEALKLSTVFLDAGYQRPEALVAASITLLTQQLHDLDVSDLSYLDTIASELETFNQRKG